MQVYAWMGFPLSIFGIQWLKYFIPHKTKNVREPRGNLSATRIKNAQQIPTTNTNLLQFDKFVNPQSFLVLKTRCKTHVTPCSDFPSVKEKVLRDTQIRSMHEMGDVKRAQELRVDEVSMQKLRENHETIQKLMLSCRKCKNR